jgi:gamma-glutamylcyclotransferase (GGCT)/AIG2-like uncharacterized protein YtfP
MIPSDPRHVFVYGTLLPGLAPPVIADTVARLHTVGPATVPGRLYDLGPYPGCTIDGTCDEVIHGQLLELPDDPAVLARLDWYEGYAAHDQAGRDLFTRTTCDAMMADGRAVSTWIYVYARDLTAARRIIGGRYDRRHP